jgi:hypothetical protein
VLPVVGRAALLLCFLLLTGARALAGGTAGLRPDGTVDFLRADGSLIASVTVEIAETEPARTRGLQERPGLASGTGMLFLYDEPRPLVFWMRNTPVSLDIIFVGADGRVSNVAARTTPLSERRLESSGPALCVVEVPAGFADRAGIRSGTTVRWQRR